MISVSQNKNTTAKAENGAIMADNYSQNDYSSGNFKGNLVYTETTRLTFLAIPWPFTHFKIYENDLVIIKGLLNLDEDDCYMYKISDVKYKRSFIQRLFGLGTIVCYVGSDATDDKIIMKNIRHGSEIKDFILAQSERNRLQRRTVNTQNLNYHDSNSNLENIDLNHNGIPDDLEH